MKTVEHRVYRSCEHMPDTPCRVVVAPQATKALSADSVRSINGFVNRGGEVVVLGCAASDPPSDVRGGKAGAKAVPEAVTAPEWELAGIRPMAGRWPMAATWRADPAAPVFAYLSAEDLVAALRGQEQVNLLRGGNRRLSTLEGDLSLISASEHGKLLWVAWPLEWDASDPRCVRLVAMALSESLFGPLRP